MANERLRTAMLEQGVTADQLGDCLGVDRKTVERWIAGRIPYPRHRHGVAVRLGLAEPYLWPGTPGNARGSGEAAVVYARRSEVPADTWRGLFRSAEREIGVLVYAGLFLSEDTAVRQILAERATAGVRVRILLGDPGSPQVAHRGAEEGVGDAMAAKIRNAMVLYEDIRESGVEFRLHASVLYNSIYFGDDQMLVNTHVYGATAAASPVLRLRRTAGGELVPAYMSSFERVWGAAVPWPAAALAQVTGTA